MAERCPDCERPISRVADDYVLGLTEDRCIQVDSDGAYLMSNCSEFTLKLLRSRITKLETVVEQAKRLRRAIAVHNHAYSCLPAFDDAMVELEREQGGEET